MSVGGEKKKKRKDLKDCKIHIPAQMKNRSNVLIYLIPENCKSPLTLFAPPPLPPLRYPGTVLPRGLQAVLPHSDQLHVRGGEAVPPRPEGLHPLPVAAARRGWDRDAAVLRRPLAAQRAGAAAGSAHPRRAPRQRQGAAVTRLRFTRIHQHRSGSTIGRPDFHNGSEGDHYGSM